MSFYPKSPLFVLFLLFPLIACATSSPVSAFDLWLEQFKAEARSQGVSEHTLQEAFRGIKVNPRIIALDRKQPEKKKTFQQYLASAVTDARVKEGRALYRKHHALLAQIGAEYGVQPRFIVSLWGIETSFGQNTGNTRLVEALATLAYDGRRSAFFRSELLLALKLLDSGHFTADSLKGSWAGAMGQTQFMPSSYYKYAVDYDKDGFADIWNSQADIFASIAHYLASVGWEPALSWGRKVKLPKPFDRSLAGIEQVKPLTSWALLGIKNSDGAPLPEKPLPASLVILDEQVHEAYLVYNNYKTLLDWNRSTYFATSVSVLADKIGMMQKN